MKGTGTIEIVNTVGADGKPVRLLRLTRLEGGEPVLFCDINMPETRPNPITGKPRILKGSLLNVDQALDELFQARNHIA